MICTGLLYPEIDAEPRVTLSFNRLPHLHEPLPSSTSGGFLSSIFGDGGGASGQPTLDLPLAGFEKYDEGKVVEAQKDPPITATKLDNGSTIVSKDSSVRYATASMDALLDVGEPEQPFSKVVRRERVDGRAGGCGGARSARMVADSSVTNVPSFFASSSPISPTFRDRTAASVCTLTPAPSMKLSRTPV